MWRKISVLTSGRQPSFTCLSLLDRYTIQNKLSFYKSLSRIVENFFVLVQADKENKGNLSWPF